MMNERIQIINIFVNLNFADTPYCAPPSVWFENTVTILPLFFIVTQNVLVLHQHQEHRPRPKYNAASIFVKTVSIK
jgi:hypothetical protein